ncbi:MAG: nickel pincer cofactor biosynthesis protein LarB, partial [Actinomycetota bacterium]
GQVVEALRGLLGSTEGAVLATRCNADQVSAVALALPEARIEPDCGVVVARDAGRSPPLGVVAIVTAGTSDLPVGREATVVAAALGAKVDLLADRGVAGLHRTLAAADAITDADVVIAVAGMEGALPSVIGGLTAAPVIAVPTSTGYGSSFEGITAMLAMMSSCTPGIGVVGIDNGFGAAALAIRILKGQTR